MEWFSGDVLEKLWKKYSKERSDKILLVFLNNNYLLDLGDFMGTTFLYDANVRVENFKSLQKA